MEEDLSPLRRLHKHLTVGNIWIYILALLKKGKHHAYALDDAIEKEYGFRPNKIMVYVVLYKLEAEGLITAEQEDRRKYYKLTKKGTEATKEAKKYLQKVSKVL